VLTIYRQLNNNNIQVIEDNAFSNLPNLKYLLFSKWLSFLIDHSVFSNFYLSIYVSLYPNALLMVYIAMIELNRYFKFGRLLKALSSITCMLLQYFSSHIWLKLHFFGITLINFIPVWLCSLFDSSQNVSHIYKQILSWKSRSTCSIIFCIWILVKFCYSFV
jgi:hypothetical protein